MKMHIYLNSMNNRNNTVPMGLSLWRYYSGYQSTVPLALCWFCPRREWAAARNPVEALKYE
jgi:hypothetical protein